MANAMTLRLPKGTNTLPDWKGWTNRFEVRSETSGRVYVVSQNERHRHWGCSCPGWRTHRKCKHLTALALPAHERPHEVLVQR